MRDPIHDRPEAIPTTAPAVVGQHAARSFSEIAATLSYGFTILRRVGVHENTSLYLARNHNTLPTASPCSTDVVILKVLDDTRPDSRRLESFRLETRAAARLLHKNIVKSGEAQKASDIYYCVVQYKPEAETLRSLLDRKAPLDTEMASAITSQVADALEYAHANGVLHLKLRPEDILVEPDGTTLVAGFGIDAVEESSWAYEERARRCDVRYLSPEQAGGGRGDRRSDLYSLGVILFEMLNGHIPYDSDNLSREDQTNQNTSLPHTFCPDVPEPLRQAAAGLLEKDPRRRIQSAATLKAILSGSIDLSQACGVLTEEDPITRLEDYSGEEDDLLVGTVFDSSSPPSAPGTGQVLEYGFLTSDDELVIEGGPEALNVSKDQPSVGVEPEVVKPAQNVTEAERPGGQKLLGHGTLIISAVIVTVAIIVFAYTRDVLNTLPRAERPSILDDDTRDSQTSEAPRGAVRVETPTRDNPPDTAERGLKERTLPKTQVDADVMPSKGQRIRPQQGLGKRQRLAVNEKVKPRDDGLRTTLRRFRSTSQKEQKVRRGKLIEMENAATAKLEAERRARQAEQRPRRVKTLP